MQFSDSTRGLRTTPDALALPLRADIKGANQKQRNERLNRGAQAFLYGCIAGEGEGAAKMALAVLTELWRRHVWRDARTANVIGARATSEPSTCHLSVTLCASVPLTAAGTGISQQGQEPHLA